MEKTQKRRNLTFGKKAADEKRELVPMERGFTRDSTMVSDDVIEARHNYSLSELKTLLRCTTLINHDKNGDDTALKRYAIPLDSLFEKLGLRKTRKIEHIHGVMRKLCESVLEFRDEIAPTRKGKINYHGYPVFQAVEFIYDEMMVYLDFNSYVMPYLLNLRRYAKLKMSIIDNFQSIYALRFYLWIKNFRKMRERTFTVQEVFEKFKLDKKHAYHNWTRLFRYVITPAIKELNEKSDVFVDFNSKLDIKKTGHKVTAFTLHFGNKSSKIADDFVEWIKSRYRKAKSFSVFKGVKVKIHDELPEIYELTQIRSNKGTYYEAMYGEHALFGKSEKNDFIDELAKHIHRACAYIAENERKEKLPFEEWHEKKIQIEDFKRIFISWTQPQTGAPVEKPVEKPAKQGVQGFERVAAMKKELDEKIKARKRS